MYALWREQFTAPTTNISHGAFVEIFNHGSKALGESNNSASGSTYDAFDQLTKSVNGAGIATFGYDALGDTTYAADGAGTYTYEYDPIGQKTLQAFSDADGDSLTLNYSYNNSGDLSEISDSQANAEYFQYNDDNELTLERVETSADKIERSLFTYNPEGQVTTIDNYTTVIGGSPSLIVNDSYDVNGNLTTEIESHSTTTVLVSYTNTYDKDNRITSEDRNGTTTSYSYDSLSEVTGDGSTSYSYDANGNESASSITTGPYNELTYDGTWSYTYDAVGNLVKQTDAGSGETWYYSYDFNNRLIGATETNSGDTTLEQASYGYDVYGNLVKEVVITSAYEAGPATTTYKHSYDGNVIYADLNSSGTVETMYDSGDQSGVFYGRIDNGTVFWMVQDHLGSVRDIINSTGTSVVGNFSYDAFGNLTYTGTMTVEGNYTFAGAPQDPATGLQFDGARVYNPETHQWMQVDPSNVQGGLSNFREYAGNDGLNETDPSGMAGTPDLITVRGKATLADAEKGIADQLPKIKAEVAKSPGEILIGIYDVVADSVTVRLFGSTFTFITVAVPSQALADTRTDGLGNIVHSGGYVRAEAYVKALSQLERAPTTNLPNGGLTSTLQDKTVLTLTKDGNWGKLIIARPGENAVTVLWTTPIKELGVTKGGLNTNIDAIIDYKTIVEEKNGKGLNNPKNKQTEAQWAASNIFDKTVIRITRLNDGTGTKKDPNYVGPDTLPTVAQLQKIREFRFEIQGNSPALQTAVQAEIQKLTVKYPGYTFTPVFAP